MLTKSSFLSIALILVLSSSCAKSLTLSYMSDARVNNGFGVWITIYQLRNDLSIREASFESLSENDVAVLGADLVKFRRVFVEPNTRLSDIKLSLAKDTRFIAVCADYHQPSQNGWRYIDSVSAFKKKQIKLFANRLRIVHK